jgi:hypothetical protein
MINQMIHDGFDVRGGDAMPLRPLFCKVWEASAVSAHIVSNLFDDLPCAPNRVSAAPRMLGRPSIDVSAQPRELKERLP